MQKIRFWKVKNGFLKLVKNFIELKDKELKDKELNIKKETFIGLHSQLMQNKIDQLCKRFFKSLKVKLVFTSEKLRCVFSTKDPYKSEHLSKVVYKFVCASCNASYVSQTCHLAPE